MQDTRCCGTGICLVDIYGRCWCGQQWDGEQMCRPGQHPTSAENKAAIDDALTAGDAESQPF
ncbi:hypothetical protein [Polaromonas sp.]|uniref:hypothetical protein n=1 Tax=Polaromonas sp. TaxID=1869339 RepID=UPI001857B0B6|nr:hypothetical protein [Polaromonas sp.]NMM05807.1 hypothetical protein [Polaromonas sp.]